MADTPDPGTQEAQDAGCSCRIPMTWLDLAILRPCPLHGIDPDYAKDLADERKRLAREDRDDG